MAVFVRLGLGLQCSGDSLQSAAFFHVIACFVDGRGHRSRYRGQREHADRALHDEQRSDPAGATQLIQCRAAESNDQCIRNSTTRFSDDGILTEMRPGLLE